MRLAIAILLGVVVVLEALRRRSARQIAERWLTQHNYRVRRLRPVYLSMRPHFRATPFRNNRWAVDFRAEVDDVRLGGTGAVRLRVWTDLLGMMDREPEISWDRMPTLTDGGAPTPEMEWENAQNLGLGKQYVRMKVPGNAYMYPAYDLNHSFSDCDVYVSMSKLKNHWIAGVTMSLKNNFGITPCSLYGSDCGPSGNEDPKQERGGVCHNGTVATPAGMLSGAEVRNAS